MREPNIQDFFLRANVPDYVREGRRPDNELDLRKFNEALSEYALAMALYRRAVP